MDKREDIISKVTEYKELVQRSQFPLPVEKVFLFGSFAKGNARQDSDIDVAFIVKHFEGDYFKIVPLLWRLTRQIDSRIEPHVIVPDEDYAGFYEEIQKTGIQID